MHKRNFIIVLALLTAITPFLGFPRSWEDIFIAAASICVVLLAVDWRQFRKKSGTKRKRRQETEVYVENIPARSAEDFRPKNPDVFKGEAGA